MVELFLETDSASLTLLEKVSNEDARSSYSYFPQRQPEQKQSYPHRQISFNLSSNQQEWTHAAVAANISTGFAFVKAANEMEKRAEKRITIPTLTTILSMKYKTKIAIEGNMIDTITLMVFARTKKWSSFHSTSPTPSWPLTGFCTHQFSSSKLSSETSLLSSDEIPLCETMV